MHANRYAKFSSTRCKVNAMTEYFSKTVSIVTTYGADQFERKFPLTRASERCS